MLRNKSSRNAIVCLTIAVLLAACSTRHFEEPCRIHLKDGEAIYKVITDNGDTLSFPDHGAEYHNGVIEGTLANGSEQSIGVDSVSLIEISHFNMVKTTLYTVGIVALVSGALIFYAVDSFVNSI